LFINVINKEDGFEICYTPKRQGARLEAYQKIREFFITKDWPRIALLLVRIPLGLYFISKTIQAFYYWNEYQDLVLETGRGQGFSFLLSPFDNVFSDAIVSDINFAVIILDLILGLILLLGWMPGYFASIAGAKELLWTLGIHIGYGWDLNIAIIVYQNLFLHWGLIPLSAFYLALRGKNLDIVKKRSLYASLIPRLVILFYLAHVVLLHIPIFAGWMSETLMPSFWDFHFTAITFVSAIVFGIAISIGYITRYVALLVLLIHILPEFIRMFYFHLPEYGIYFFLDNYEPILWYILMVAFAMILTTYPKTPFSIDALLITRKTTQAEYQKLKTPSGET
jgi:uncharacterized membrane protein YphA (DoxX/SURF4 family)